MIDWYLKQQATIETASYGSEMVAGKIAVEQTKEIWYVLRSIGVPIEGPSIMFGDNESVVKSTTIPNSSLKRKSLLLAFHMIREAIAANIINSFHMPGKENPVDCLMEFIHGDEWSRLLMTHVMNEGGVMSESVSHVSVEPRIPSHKRVSFQIADSRQITKFPKSKSIE